VENDGSINIMTISMIILAVVGLPLLTWHMQWTAEKYVETRSGSWWSVVHGFLNIFILFAWAYAVVFCAGTAVLAITHFKA
jgi:hypothetical protein